MKASANVREAALGTAAVTANYGTWFEVGQGSSRLLTVEYTLRADPLSSFMACMITFIGTLIAIFAGAQQAARADRVPSSTPP